MTNNAFIVTGGHGFIGSNFVNYLYDKFQTHTIIILDKLTYATSLRNLRSDVADSDRVVTLVCDLKNKHLHGYELLKGFRTDVDTNTPGTRFIGRQVDYKAAFNKRYNIDTVFHLAAESHVDNSILGPQAFIDANIQGTMNLLQLSLDHGVDKFVYVSTDEVYGSLSETDPAFYEEQMIGPNNVYSATKAGSEMLVRAFNKTHKLPTIITRCCNNYGPRQNKEKLIPKTILNALNNRSIPVYGTGSNIREWIHVTDHCSGILAASMHGTSGEIYNIGSGVEITNLEIVRQILKMTDRNEDLIEYVEDRKGHDFRYSIDCSKLTKTCSWTPKYDSINALFGEGLKETIEWYS